MEPLLMFDVGSLLARQAEIYIYIYTDNASRAG